MFSGPLPTHVNIRSPRVAVGLGTIAKTVGSGMDIYRGKLPVAEIERRLARCYTPYHRQLEQMLTATRQSFGHSLVVDCHSMPSSGAAMDMVIGDSHGLACAAEITALIERLLQSRGYQVERNHPYAGGFTTCHYGHPSTRSHSIQIEINRRLYMDEGTYQPTEGFDQVAADVTELIRELTAFMTQWQDDSL